METGVGRPEYLRELGDFITAERARLRERHRLGLGGREIARGHADLVDVVAGRASRLVAEELGPAARAELAGGAVVALGAYGRRELSPWTGIEILLVGPAPLTPAWTAFSAALPALLREAGLPVDHTVRGRDDCLAEARSDARARDALSDARLVTGSEELFRRLWADLLAEVFTDARAHRAHLDALHAEVAERRSRFGSSVGMLEPHLENAAGGLADLHLVDRVALLRHGLRHLDELLRAQLVTPAEHRQAARAADAILRVRNEAHLAAGSRADVLTLDMQPALAEALGYADRGGASASETFMRDLYRRMQELQRVTEAFLLREHFWAPAAKRFVHSPRTAAVGPQGRYRIEDGRLEAGPGGLYLERDPLRLFEIYRTAQRHGVDVGDELTETVRSRLRLVDRSLRASPAAGAAFLEILRDPGGCARVLRAMHQAGLLARYLPDFRRITLTVQHDHYHRYTIDEHTLRAVEAVDALAGAQGQELTLLRSALAEVRDRAVLVLAVLLHDIGKGRGAGNDHAGRGAAIARRIGRRIGLHAEAMEDVAFLVQKHLVMSRISQRRDLTDEAVIRGFAETVGTEDRLRMLHVLTYADLAAVAPDSWNEWKATLLDDLFRKTLPHLAEGLSGPGVPEARVALEERVLRALGPEILRSDIETFLRHLPARYARTLSPEIIARHFEMWRALGDARLATDWRASTKGPYTVLSVCAKDAPGLLADLAGALTGSGLDILSLDVFTTDDGVALDVFRVCEAAGARAVQPVATERHAEIERAMEAALRGERDRSAGPEHGRAQGARRRRVRTPHPPEVRFHPPDASGRTLIEVRADDEPGLLHLVTSCLARLGLSISYAKVATEKHQALDVFYVQERSGAEVDESRHAEIRAALLEALPQSQVTVPGMVAGAPLLAAADP